jgi:hypothetical protein
MQDLRETETRLRAVDSGLHASLRTKRTELATAAQDDVAAASAALLAGADVPKPRAAKLHDEIRDIEKRQLLAVDDAMWQLAGQVRDALRPDADAAYRSMVDRQLRRWQRPDPKNVGEPSPTRHLARRPRDIVAWVEQGIANVDRLIAEQKEKDERDRRKRDATNAVNSAQAAYEREQSIAFEERLARMSVTARTAAELEAKKSTPWAPFDRRAWLEREGLTADYGWRAPGQSITVQGNPDAVRAMHAPPARETAPATTSATEA